MEPMPDNVKCDVEVLVTLEGLCAETNCLGFNASVSEVRAIFAGGVELLRVKAVTGLVPGSNLTTGDEIVADGVGLST